MASFSATRTPGSAGESKKNDIVKRPSGIMKERSANCTNKIRKGSRLNFIALLLSIEYLCTSINDDKNNCQY